MAVSLTRALMKILTDWLDDPRSESRGGDVELGFGNAGRQLELEFREPTFPVRRDRKFPGTPVRAPMLRAFERIQPHRAFEASNVASGLDLDKIFSKSVGALIRQNVAARMGDSGDARNLADWPKTLAAIESDDGVLLLNASRIPFRFRVDVDPDQVRGFLPFWRPSMIIVLRAFFDRRAPLVVTGFSDVAAAMLRQAGLREGGAAATPASARSCRAR